MKLSIVIIEYNSIDDIRVFEDHIKKNFKGIEYELIVSSNSQYSDAEQERIKNQFPNLHWSFNERNGGFAYGMNRGLELAQGDYLMIANPDLKLKYGLPEAVEFLQSHPEIGAIGPLTKDEEGVAQDSARSYLTLSSWVLRQCSRLLGKEQRFDFSRTQTVDWVIGACILMSREAYKLTGGLDEHYFLYAEDLDLCTRIRQVGLEVVFYPKMEVEYKGTRSARHSKKYAKIFMQSLWYYWKKFGFFYGQPERKEIEY